MWYLYVLRCSDGTLYTGVTTDLVRRAAEHNAGRGSRYTAGRRPVELIASWPFTDRSAAQGAEAAFRRQSRAKKLALIGARLPFLGSRFVDPP
jgi:putative endonuclease